jgi:hypothetical protein
LENSEVFIGDPHPVVGTYSTVGNWCGAVEPLNPSFWSFFNVRPLSARAPLRVTVNSQQHSRACDVNRRIEPLVGSVRRAIGDFLTDPMPESIEEL